MDQNSGDKLYNESLPKESESLDFKDIVNNTRDSWPNLWKKIIFRFDIEKGNVNNFISL